MAFGTARHKRLGFHYPLVVLLALVALSALSTAVPVAAMANPAAAEQDHGHATGKLLASWVELGPNGTQFARAITNVVTCPVLTVDRAALAMTTRASAHDPSFPVTVCEATIPRGAKTASIGGRHVGLLTGAPRRIAIIGDTGCLMQAPSYFQVCNDPAQWPFARIAAQVAAWHPDLIIHIGDFLLRENACPAGNTGCAGNSFGDNWPAWKADFFDPATDLLPVAPWIVVRGNHENCGRGGNGWFRFLDPRALPGACPVYTDPYAVPVGSTNLVVLDSAAASDTTTSPDQVAEYRRQLGLVGQLAGSNGWLLSHRPIWGPIELNSGATLATGNATLQAASDNKLPVGIKLVLAGHVHLAEVLSFDPVSERPPVFIVGNSGVVLDPDIRRSLPGIDLAGATVVTGKVIHASGYLTLRSVDEGWTATEHDVTGSTIDACGIRGLTVTCSRTHATKPTPAPKSISAPL